MKILVIDVGGTNIKVLATGHKTPIKIPSGPDLTPSLMVRRVRQAVKDWEYEAVSIGYPGAVLEGKPVSEPKNLGSGWVRFNFKKAFGCPVKMINDAAMQALGSYQKGRMLFLGLGTGLGSALVIGGVVQPMELAHLPFRKETFEDYVGERGRDRLGKKKWRAAVLETIERLSAALQVDYVVLGGGNVKYMNELPDNVRVGGNENAFRGAFRLWDS